MIAAQPIPKLKLTPGMAGARLTPEEFDAAILDDDEVDRYELIDGRLIWIPQPDIAIRDANGELGYLVNRYRYEHRSGAECNATVHEHEVIAGSDRLRVDRAVWAGLGRHPRADETPTFTVEFVSMPSRLSEYDVRHESFRAAGIVEYWIIDRFARTMTVHRNAGGRSRKTVVREGDSYTTPLLPGFELPLDRLLGVADDWSGRQ